MAKTKALPFTIPKATNAAIIAQLDREKRFYGKLHQHNQIQLSYIFKGSGTLFAGNSIIPYHNQELVVIGSNVPHLFESNPNSNAFSERISIFVDPEWILSLTQNNPELHSLEFLVKRSKAGFVIKDSKSKVADLVAAVLNQKQVLRFLNFIALLNAIKNIKYEGLNNNSIAKPYSATDEARMQKLLDYTLSNYANAISLNQAAQQTALTPTAFCKYFKKRTGKTYIEFLNHVRIEASCQKLQESNELSIEGIAYSCGFSSLSNFNRQFKRIKQTTPRAYREFIKR